MYVYLLSPELTPEQRRVLQTQPEAVSRVFKYHAIPGKISTDDLVGGKVLRTDSDDVTAAISVSVYHNRVSKGHIISPLLVLTAIVCARYTVVCLLCRPLSGVYDLSGVWC